MKKACFFTILLLSATPAMAEDITCFLIDGPATGQKFFECPQPSGLTEETKAWALKRAYELNGNSMVRWGSIDLSKEVQNAKPVKTIPIIPTDPKIKNEIDDKVDELQRKWVRLRGDKIFAEDDVCKRHGMHRVTKSDGLSWRCRK